MQSRASFLGAIVLFVTAPLGPVLDGAWADPPPASDAGSRDDESAAIKRGLDGQVAAWNRGDLDGFMALYWNDPGLVFQSGPTRTDGFDSTRDRYRARYKAEGKEMGTLAFSGVEIKVLGPDTAFARGRWGLTMKDGSNPAGLFTLVLRKLPEGWRIVHDHTSK